MADHVVKDLLDEIYELKKFKEMALEGNAKPKSKTGAAERDQYIQFKCYKEGKVIGIDYEKLKARLGSDHSWVSPKKPQKPGKVTVVYEDPEAFEVFAQYVNNDGSALALNVGPSIKSYVNFIYFVKDLGNDQPDLEWKAVAEYLAKLKTIQLRPGSTEAQTFFSGIEGILKAKYEYASIKAIQEATQSFINQHFVTYLGEMKSPMTPDTTVTDEDNSLYGSESEFN